MENNNTAQNGGQSKQPQSTRRVGTFTLGLTLIACGALLLARIFFPALDVLWILQFSPVVLILLGIEMLMRAARTDEKLRYDWLSIFVCFVLLCGTAVAAVVPEIIRYEVRTPVYTDLQPDGTSIQPQVTDGGIYATPEDAAAPATPEQPAQ